MGNIRSFKELRVWQNAIEAAMLIFKVTSHFPIEERYSLTDQVRRSSRSVASNIAEAWRKRRYCAAFVSKLNDAEAEAAETQTWIEFSLRCGYLDAIEAKDFDQRYEMILRQLVAMIEKSEEWVVGANRKKDAVAVQRATTLPELSPSRRVCKSPRRQITENMGIQL